MTELSEAELQEIVDNLEKILEVFPHDSAILHTLIEAYRHQNLEEKYTDCLLQLAEAAAISEDPDKASLAISLFERLAVSTPNQDEILTKLRRVADSGGEDALSQVGSHDPDRPGGRSISGELALAWKLMKADEIDQEEYSSIVQDLTENASKQMDVPVSVLHVLQDRGMKNLEKIIAAIIVDSGVPLITLSNFELDAKTFGTLPRHFMTQRGAILFETMGEHALIALLNPYDKVLQNELIASMKKPCHFYLTTAAEYDKALEFILPQLTSPEIATPPQEAAPAGGDAEPGGTESPPTR